MKVTKTLGMKVQKGNYGLMFIRDRQEKAQTEEKKKDSLIADQSPRHCLHYCPDQVGIDFTAGPASPLSGLWMPSDIPTCPYNANPPRLEVSKSSGLYPKQSCSF
ncbi:hypothetical protein M9H77_16838 [Catharanthus roseus]|uniref:Uncharacterized protein n=1 Tax=Catharanthus roseus TaxID=4058 RepID=A0ACC0B2V5_CATRO|nr:hypothetical protein M9H77_16838 [Catharanthus roseus]